MNSTQEEVNKAIDKALFKFSNQIKDLTSDVMKYGTEHHKSELLKIYKSQIKNFMTTKFRVKEVIDNLFVENRSFVSEMTPCCGNIYTFYPIEEQNGWFESKDDKNVEGWSFHRSWLEEVE